MFFGYVCPCHSSGIVTNVQKQPIVFYFNSCKNFSLGVSIVYQLINFAVNIRADDAHLEVAIASQLAVIPWRSLLIFGSCSFRNLIDSVLLGCVNIIFIYLMTRNI